MSSPGLSAPKNQVLKKYFGFYLVSLLGSGKYSGIKDGYGQKIGQLDRCEMRSL
jgi:hypothetical protein